MNHPPRSVLFVTRNFPPAIGGIETMAFQLLGYASNKRNENYILVHFGQRPNTNPPVKASNYLHFWGKGRISTWLNSALIIPVLALRYRPEKIINMQVTTALGSYLSQKLLKIPYAVVCLGLEVMPSESKLYNLLRKKVLGSAFRTLSISRYTDGLVAQYGILPESRVVLPLGVDLTVFKPQPSASKNVFDKNITDKDFICLSVCRLVPRKGMDLVIKALAKMDGSDDTTVKYFIGGRGPDRPRLEKLVSDLGLSQRVFFLGRVPEEWLSTYYSAADVFVHPSRSTRRPPEVEGFGLVFLEAAACGTPSIGSTSGGIPDAIVDGVTGYLVDPEDTAGLADKILYLKNNKDILERLGKQARERALRDCSWEKAAENYFVQIFGEH